MKEPIPDTAHRATTASDEPVLDSELYASVQPSSTEVLSVEQTTCCVVGGGPAGVMLSYLLARFGVPVTLLESHKDFDRKFRGDTIHPSVLENLDQLGLADKLLQLPHTKTYGPTLETSYGTIQPIDFRRLKTKFPYIMLIPQEAFLNFMVEQASQYPAFQVRMGANVQDVVTDGGVIRGVRYRSHDGIREVHADLTIGADGRHSRMRRLLGFEPVATSAPMDVLWFNLPILPEGPPVDGLFGRVGEGRALILFERVDHLQVGYIFTKGRYQRLKKAGLDAFKESIIEVEPRLKPHLASLTTWRDLTLLSVESNRCRRWYTDGALLIGDAAHVMTPVGGVGINYAIHDAIEAANVLTQPLKDGVLQTKDLAEVQKRRETPTRRIQKFQSVVQNQLVKRVLDSNRPIHIPWLLRWALKITYLRDIPARIIAFGFGRSQVQLQDDSHLPEAVPGREPSDADGST